MSVTRFNRLTRPDILRRISRSHLEQFLGAFAAGFQARGLALPDPAQPDAAWFPAVADLLRAPEGLPDGLHEAVCVIDEMAHPEAHEQLEAALFAKEGFRLAPESSPEDLAVQTWLAAPDLLTRLHNQQRMRRLASFECFHHPGGAPGSAAPVAAPDAAALARLTTALDAWFARHNRGRQTVRVELYPPPAAADSPSPGQPADLWFLVQHGDTMTRRPAVDGPQREIIGFRPERDDVVVHSPAQAEIRISARTKAQRELYRQEFGRLLHGDPEYFSERETYTLEPLRTGGRDILSAHGLQGIFRITLHQLEVVDGADPDLVTTYQASDLFAPRETDEEPFPRKTGHTSWVLRQRNYEPGQQLEREQTV